MARKFLTAIDLAKNELQNAVHHPLAAAPSSPVKFQMYGNTADNTLYWWDGTSWASARGGGTGFPGFGAVTQEQTFGATKNDGVGTTTARNDHTHGNPVHDNAAHSAINLSALATPTAAVSFNSQRITSLADPTAATDAANKQYVDNLSAGLSWKDAVRAATTAAGTLATSFANGSVIDGVTLATGNRILIKNQATASENGIYTVNASGAPTRATDADAAAELEGAAVFVQEGTALADTGWVMTANAPITVGTTNLTWAQFSGAGAAVPLTRTINTTAPLTGGGDLSADRTFAISASTEAATGVVELATAAETTAGTDNTRAVHPAGLFAAAAARRFAANVGGATSQAVTHNLNTRDVRVEVYRNSTPWDTVDCDVERTDVNNVTVRFTTAPASNEYRVLVLV